MPAPVPAICEWLAGASGCRNERLRHVTGLDLKGNLHQYLQGARETLVWKLEGLGEYDIRRPLTRTGTNLLGLIKHNAISHARYFGEVFDRPFSEPLPRWDDLSAFGTEHWATEHETRAEVVDFYRRVWSHSDATINAVPLDSIGRVPWWGDAGHVTLQGVLVHMTAETQRHAGHADIVRELIDGSAGLLKGHDNLPPFDEAWWADHRDQLERAARAAAH
jgi:hypothetical protein